VRPSIGSPGCIENLVCDYGLCQVRDAVSLQCTENTWVLMGATFLAGDIVSRNECR
jgi:hypothetical protein